MELYPASLKYNWNGVHVMLYSIKHVSMNELDELVETIARTNLKSARS